MFPNNDRSNFNISTNNNNLPNLNNNCFDNHYSSHGHLKESSSNSQKVIIITKHLCIPCPCLYSDIFKTILIVCKDPSHKNDKKAGDSKLNEKIQNFLNTK